MTFLNEVFGSKLASKLSEQQANTLFLEAAMKKCKKLHILLSVLFLKIYVKKILTGLGPCAVLRTIHSKSEKSADFTSQSKKICGKNAQIATMTKVRISIKSL